MRARSTSTATSVGSGETDSAARIYASGVEQVADEALHVCRLLGDDAEERAHLRTVERRCGVVQGDGGAGDRGERRAQLVAHHVEERGALAFEFVERTKVLERHDDSLHLTPAGTDRGRVDQRGDVPAVGERKRDLLGTQGRGATQFVRQRELVEVDLAAIGKPAGDRLEQVLGRQPRGAQALDHPPRLAVQ